MNKREFLTLAAGAGAAGLAAACTPTVRVQVDPINIYVRSNPDLF
jgi:hypothetical protein